MHREEHSTINKNRTQLGTTKLTLMRQAIIHSGRSDTGTVCVLILSHEARFVWSVEEVVANNQHLISEPDEPDLLETNTY